MGKADLHIHTNASDGLLSVPELLKKISEKGLRSISITDHDTIDALEEASRLAPDYGIELIPGAELTARWKGKEVHLLAYFFDPTDSTFLSLIARQKRARKERMKKITQLLKKEGVEIEYDEIRAAAGRANMGRPHAARILVKKGYASSVPEAFIRYLSTEKLGDVATEYAEVDEIIKIVSSSGGVVSVAHPGRIYTNEELLELLSLHPDGIECIHPSHTYSQQRHYASLARKQNLLITGGSDYHGSVNSDYDPHLGIVTLGQQHLDSIRRTSENKVRFYGKR